MPNDQNETTPRHDRSKARLRSRAWFDNPHNPDMTALYLERYLNYGLTRHELQSGKPIIGIAQTGNDLSPCNRHHLELAHRVRELAEQISADYAGKDVLLIGVLKGAVFFLADLMRQLGIASA